MFCIKIERQLWKSFYLWSLCGGEYELCGVCVAQRSCGGQRTTPWSRFSHSALAWVLGIKLNSAGWCSQHRQPQSPYCWRWLPFSVLLLWEIRSVGRFCLEVSLPFETKSYYVTVALLEPTLWAPTPRALPAPPPRSWHQRCVPPHPAEMPLSLNWPWLMGVNLNISDFCLFMFLRSCS